MSTGLAYSPGIAALEGKDSAECYADLVCDHAIAGIIFALNEQAMQDFMPNHYVFTSSDGMTCRGGPEQYAKSSDCY